MGAFCPYDMHIFNLFIFVWQLHEAIMREDSTEFEVRIMLEEFCKGFQLGDRLLRPSMVKVSSGPGPAKPEQVGCSSGGADTANKTTQDIEEPKTS